jgi:hypothetical protein
MSRTNNHLSLIPGFQTFSPFVRMTVEPLKPTYRLDYWEGIFGPRKQLVFTSTQITPLQHSDKEVFFVLRNSAMFFLVRLANTGVAWRGMMYGPFREMTLVERAFRYAIVRGSFNHSSISTHAYPIEPSTRDEMGELVNCVIMKCQK